MAVKSPVCVKKTSKIALKFLVTKTTDMYFKSPQMEVETCVTLLFKKKQNIFYIPFNLFLDFFQHILAPKL